jgi:high affinity Mn2+ porin
MIRTAIRPRLPSFPFALWFAAVAAASCALAQVPVEVMSEKPEPAVAEESTPAMFPHFKEGRYWISGQANFIFQTHPSFYAKYSGPNSLQPDYEKATSRVLTLYTGFQFTKSAEILVNIEEAGGNGLSGALGVAGFMNFDVVRNPTIGQQPYFSRLLYHQVFALSHDSVEATRGPLSTFSELPSRRLDLRFGKFCMCDFFDVNSVGSDSHLQFMNWSVGQNGAFDFAADTRGYTWGAIVEYQSPKWGVRFAEALLPSVANGPDLVWNLARSNASNIEFEIHRGFLRKKDGIVRLLAWVNNANMGIYRVANEEYLAGKVPQPDIKDHLQQVTTKFGFGINMEQLVARNIVVYGRFGWNNGATESWAYTEIDQTVAGGVGFLGPMWRRKYDRAGFTFVTNGISSEHASYLSYGGLGFILGDGGLTYGRENIFENYYTAHLWRGIYLGPDLQYIVHPGYNKVRGPVFVPGFRVHLEL